MLYINDNAANSNLFNATETDDSGRVIGLALVRERAVLHRMAVPPTESFICRLQDGTYEERTLLSGGKVCRFKKIVSRLLSQ